LDVVVETIEASWAWKTPVGGKVDIVSSSFANFAFARPFTHGYALNLQKLAGRAKQDCDE